LGNGRNDSGRCHVVGHDDVVVGRTWNGAANQDAVLFGQDPEQLEILDRLALVAHLTAGHTRGCTTWTTAVQDGGRTYNVVFACSYRSPAVVTPDIEAEFNRTFKLLRTLPCDVPLGDHPAQYNLAAKYARVKPGAPNPFIDREGCWYELLPGGSGMARRVCGAEYR